MPAAAPIDEGQYALGQRERQMLPHGLAEAGVGDAEQAREVEPLRAVDDLVGAVGEQLPDALRHVERRGEEELGQQVDAAQRHARADMPDGDGEHRHQRLRDEQSKPARAHAAWSRPDIMQILPAGKAAPPRARADAHPLCWTGTMREHGAVGQREVSGAEGAPRMQRHPGVADARRALAGLRPTTARRSMEAPGCHETHRRWIGPGERSALQAFGAGMTLSGRVRPAAKRRHAASLP